MEVKITRVTGWERVANAARMTIHKGELGKEPSDAFKENILRAEHSPIRLLEFDIVVRDVPYYVIMHLVRHTQGIEKFVATSREDRTGVNRDERRQTDPVDAMFSCNAQALINISRKRLCSQADVMTRMLWQEVILKVAKIEPLVAKFCVKECVYRGFCPEIHTCGATDSPMFSRRLEEYRTR